jgi:lipopolysaccharide biosynthesis protein
MNNKIIVFFHIYYSHLIDEYLWYLNNIKKSNYDFDLYISICSEVINDDIMKKLIEFKNDTIITITINRGADIGGFFHTIRNNNIDLDLYCACLYLHTKESKQFGEIISYQWRGQLLNDILLTPDLINFCVDKIINNTGIIGSSKCIYSINNSLKQYKIELNHYTNLCNRLKLKLNNTYFVAGTIFWCNLQIIKYIINSNITSNDFELGFEHNGLLAHGFERIFGNISTELSLPILGIILDINSTIYHSNFKLYNENYKNIHTYKIITNIVLPNETKIKNIIIKKLKIDRINKIKNNLKY